MQREIEAEKEREAEVERKRQILERNLSEEHAANKLLTDELKQLRKEMQDATEKSAEQLNEEKRAEKELQDQLAESNKTLNLIRSDLAQQLKDEKAGRQADKQKASRKLNLLEEHLKQGEKTQEDMAKKISKVGKSLKTNVKTRSVWKICASK